VKGKMAIMMKHKKKLSLFNMNQLYFINSMLITTIQLFNSLSFQYFKRKRKKDRDGEDEKKITT
jgi:hypothetical protein